jgi:isopentenyl diphosphate isomerase/L-lactate dehydrogenase-like FMN-dependent dehydrogenase
MSAAREARRQLLRFLLASPLVTGAAALSAWWPGRAGARPELAIPDTAARALDVFQVRAAARRVLEPAPWHFIVNGADDGKTVAANRRAFDDWQIRVRRLVDVSRVDTSVELFGQVLNSPILLAPAGDQQFVHPDGELATARAAARNGHVMVCSTISSHAIGEIAAAADAPLWFQLYASRHRPFMRYLLDRAAEAGCRAAVLTIDGPTIGNREGERWFRGRTERGRARMGNFEAYSGKKNIGDPSLTWEIVSWLRANTRLKIMLKGIVTREDAALCAEHGVDGVIVSNHGGRQEESGRGTLACLPEVLEAVDGRLPVLIDGGFRRGTDVFKALALGARAVCIGRPYLWGLGAFGEAGVARVLALLDAELVRIMKLAGTVDIAAIDPAYLRKA